MCFLQRYRALLLPAIMVLTLTELYAEEVSLEGEAFIGIIEPRQLIKVGSPVLGVVAKVPVERGDRIEKGALIAQLESDIEQIEVDLAQTRYEMAKKRYHRQEFLQKKQLGSNEDFDQSAMEMALARLEVERRKLLLQQKYIGSPVTGVITEKLVSRGEYIYEQTPIVVVAQTDPLNVEVLLPLKEFGRIKEGMTAQVIPQPPLTGNYTAKVEIVDKVMNAASSTFGIRLRLANGDQNIPSGVKCTVRFKSQKIGHGNESESDAMMVLK